VDRSPSTLQRETHAGEGLSPEDQLLLACLDRARPIGAQHLAPLDLDWDRVLAEASDHGVLPLLYVGLNTHTDRTTIPPAVMDWLTRAYYQQSSIEWTAVYGAAATPAPLCRGRDTGNCFKRCASVGRLVPRPPSSSGPVCDTRRPRSDARVGRSALRGRSSLFFSGRGCLRCASGVNACRPLAISR
jgi:hypothetical protein